MINITGDIIIPSIFIIMFIFWILMPLYSLFRTRDYPIEYGNKLMETYINLIKDGRLK